MAGMLLVISGPSGAGKTTIAREVERAFPDAVFSVSVTTRPRATKDRDGVDYHFIDDAAFDRLIGENELLEWAAVFDRRYGTPRRPVEQTLDHGGLMILEIDVRGARQVRQRTPAMLGVFVLPPSRGELLRRLRDRNREDEATIQRRFREAEREIDEAQAGGIYDAFVVNDDLDKAVAITNAIVKGERQRRAAR